MSQAMTAIRGFIGLKRDKARQEGTGDEPVEEEVDELDESSSQLTASADRLAVTRSNAHSASASDHGNATRSGSTSNGTNPKSGGSSGTQGRAGTAQSVATATSSIEAPAPGQGQGIASATRDDTEAATIRSSRGLYSSIALEPGTAVSSMRTTTIPPTAPPNGQAPSSRNAAAAFGLTGDTGGVKLPPPDGIIKASMGGVQANG